MRVRPAEPSDAAAIAAVHVAGWEGAYRGMVPDEAFEQRTLARRTALWEELLGGSGDPVTNRPPWVAVAERTGTTIGFISLGAPGGRAIEITALYVDPSAWRGGAGTALMDAALAESARTGAAAVTLWVLEPNTRARAFYERCGFADDGERQREDDGWPLELRMRRAL
jgi:ribosomal protein S18 acetylase RimI-like enzyme